MSDSKSGALQGGVGGSPMYDRIAQLLDSKSEESFNATTFACQRL